MIIGSKKRLSQVITDLAINVGNLELRKWKRQIKSLGLMLDTHSLV